MSRPDASPLIRPADRADADAVAALHAASWRDTYRGSLSDAYLDGPIHDERRAFWTRRLAHPPAGLITLVAEADSGLCGFVCALADHDPAWGTLIDNLYVASRLQRTGLGRQLMGEMADALAARRLLTPVHLFVLVANRAAATFYARLGGAAVERMVATQPDGSALPVDRIAWTSLDDFATRVRAP